MTAADQAEAVVQRFAAGFASQLTFRVTERMVARFASLTGDRSSLHVSDEFARHSMYRRLVVHGMLPVSYLLLCPGLVIDGRSAAVVAVSARFAAPTHAGEELTLTVTLATEQRAAREVAFDFRIERSREAVTVGTLVLTYGPAVRTQKRQRALSVEDASLVTYGLAMRNLKAAEINKGDRDGFEFCVTDAASGAFEALLLEGIADTESTALPADGRGLDSANLLAVTLLSTLVGMRLPGESATFLEFSATLPEPLQSGRIYRLEGKVAHVSRATNIVKTDVSIAAVDGGGGSLVGKVAALVTRPSNAARTIESLRTSAADLGLKDKVVLITGASGAIGETTAKLFALHESRVVLNYRRNQDDAERIVREIEGQGGAAIALQADVSDLAEVRAMVEQAVARFGGIDILVNNAVRDFRSIAYADLRWDDVQADLDVNVKGAFHCCKSVTPYMLERGGGKIVNISSIYADNPPADQLKYVVSKAALEGLARALAVEFADRNIQVNTVVPSFVDTDIASQMYDSLRKKKAQEAPMRRNATPEDVAQTVLFLASNFSSYTTGQRILVTGGAPYL
jgi:3-oxoacyl-[acyl-carrier protein] reductase